MTRRWIRVLVMARLLTMVLAVASTARAQAVSPGDQQAAVQAFVEKYYGIYAAKDLDAVTAMWDPASPDLRSTTGTFRALFQFQDFVFSRVRVARVRTDDAAVVTARVSVEAAITNLATKRTDQQRWLRTFTLHAGADGWTIWRDVPAGDDLVAELMKLDTEEKRFARLVEEPDLAPEDVRAVVDREANRAFAARDNARAIELHWLSARLSERAGAVAEVAASQLNIGFVYQAQMDHRSALEWFEKALGGFQASGKADRSAATEMNVGAELYALRDYARAGEHYEKALAAFEKLAETGWTPTIRHNLGNIAYLQGNWDTALEHYRKSLEALEAASEPLTGTNLQARGIATAHQAIAMVFREQGDYPSALEALGKALARFEASRDASGTLQAHEAMGSVYRLQGDYGLSLQRYRAAWTVLQNLPTTSRDPQVEGNLLAEIGVVYALEQRYTTALGYLQRSLVLQEKVRSQEGIAAVLGGIGGMHFLLGHHDLALDHYRRGLAIRQALDQPRNVARLLAHIGLVQIAQDKTDEARASFEQSLETASLADDKAGAAIALVLIASVHAAADRTEEALGFAQKSLALATELADLDVFAHAQTVAGDLYRRRREWDRAGQSFGEAIGSLERLRAAVGPGEGRFFNDTVAPYLGMVRLLLDQERRDEAFVYLERGRQARMRDLLDGGTSIVKGLTADEQQEELKVRRRAVSLRTQVRKATGQPHADPARLASLSRRLEEATSAEKALEAQLYDAHPDLRILRARAETPGWAEVADTLVDTRTALLEYAVTDDRSYLFVITRRGAAVEAENSPATPIGPARRVGTTFGARRALRPDERPAPPAPELQVFPIEVKAVDLGKRVADFRQRLVARDPDLGSAARELYDLLLKPAEAQAKGKRRLLILPDSTLWALPFQALQPSDGRYLIEDRAVAYGSSLATLAAVARSDRGTSTAPAGRLLAIGYGEIGKAAQDQLALVRPDLKFEPLPEAAREARSLGLFFGPTRAKVLVGREADEEHLRQDGKTAGAIHLAARGLLNDASPLHSLFAFAPPAAGSDDGLADTADLLQWDLAARTVVLSRVEGESGLAAAGAAGVVLGWALFAAGAPTTVFSQWIVDAPATASLMVGFHRGVRAAAGQPLVRPSEALRLATLPLLRGRTRHPFFWAGFTVMGDVR